MKQMPLSSKQKSALHRARLTNNPEARAEYLAKRKESYQKRRNEGRIVRTPVSQMSKAEQEKQRQKWRRYQNNHRKKEMALDSVSCMTPEYKNCSSDDESKDCIQDMSEAKRAFSLVWDHFTLVTPRKVQCSLCSQWLSFNKNTSAMLRHLRSRHPSEAWYNTSNSCTGSGVLAMLPSRSGSLSILPNSSGTQSVSSSSSGSLTWFSSSSGTMPVFSGNAVSGIPLQSGSGTLSTTSDTVSTGFNPIPSSALGVHSSLNQDHEAVQNSTGVSARQIELDDALVSMMAKDSQPFSIVEDEGFSTFVRLLDPDYSLPSKLSLKGRVSAQCDFVQETMLAEVEKADFISLSSDVWTSVDGVPLVSVTGHLVTKSSQLQTFLLGISTLQEDHKYFNLEEARNQLVASLGLHSKVVALVIEKEPCSTMATRLQKLGMLEMPSLTGVLNQAVLGAMEATAELQEIRVQARTIVKYFRSDPVARDRLSVAQRQLNGTQGQKLLLETENRWNSVYVMLECLFNQRQAVAAALSTLETDILPLGSSGYEVIHQCLSVLKPFHQANVELCSEKRVSASKVIPLVHMLTMILEEQRQSMGFVRSSAATLSSQLQRALQTSFSTVETEPVLALATLLDPRFKVLGFGCQANAQEAVKLLTSECAAHIISTATGTHDSDNSSDEAALSSSRRVAASSPSTTATIVSAATSLSRSKVDGSEGLWERFDSVVGETQSVQSSAADAAVEVQRYLSDAYLLRGDNPTGYWERHSKVYPHLFVLARKYLGVPASAVPGQRLQSKAGDVFKRKRSCLSMKTVEKILILNDGLL